VIQRSNERRPDLGGGGHSLPYDGVPGTHIWYDGTQHPWEFLRVWQLQPSLTDPDTVYAGVEDAGLFRSTDGGQNWQELPGLRAARAISGSLGRGMCLHTILFDPTNPLRIFVAISSAGAFRTDDARGDLATINQGLVSPGELPDKTAEVGHCVHNLATHPSRRACLFMQKHWDVMRSDNAGDSCMKLAATCQATSASRLRCMPTNRTRSTLSRSKATRSIIRRMANCGIPQPQRRGTSGKR